MNESAVALAAFCAASVAFALFCCWAWKPLRWTPSPRSSAPTRCPVPSRTPGTVLKSPVETPGLFRLSANCSNAAAAGCPPGRPQPGTPATRRPPEFCCAVSEPGRVPRRIHGSGWRNLPPVVDVLEGVEQPRVRRLAVRERLDTRVSEPPDFKLFANFSKAPPSQQVGRDYDGRKRGARSATPRIAPFAFPCLDAQDPSQRLLRVRDALDRLRCRPVPVRRRGPPSHPAPQSSHPGARGILLKALTTPVRPCRAREAYLRAATATNERRLQGALPLPRGRPLRLSMLIAAVSAAKPESLTFAVQSATACAPPL